MIINVTHLSTGIISITATTAKTTMTEKTGKRMRIDDDDVPLASVSRMMKGRHPCPGNIICIGNAPTLDVVSHTVLSFRWQ